MRHPLVILLMIAMFCSRAGAQESTVIFKNEADFDIALSLSPYPDGAYWPTELPVVILGVASSTHSKQFELSKNTATVIRCEHCDRLRGDAFGAAGGGILLISFDDFDNMFTVGETYTFRGHSERLELSSQSGRLWSGYGLSGQGAPPAGLAAVHIVNGQPKTIKFQINDGIGNASIIELMANEAQTFVCTPNCLVTTMEERPINRMVQPGESFIIVWDIPGQLYDLRVYSH